MVSVDSFDTLRTGTGTINWTHTPVGTLRGIAVGVVVDGAADDVASITANGTPLVQASGSPVIKGTGETGTVHWYLLGSSVPGGALTMQLTTNGLALPKRVFSIGLAALADLEIVDVELFTSDSISNVAGTLNLSGRASFAAVTLMTGED